MKLKSVARRPLRMASMVFAAALCSGSLAIAQAPPVRPPPVASPQIGADGRVTFRINAPNAQSVGVAGELPRPPAPPPVAGAPFTPPAPLAMSKEAGGVWSYTTASPIPAGAWRYSFVVDGVRVIDPANVSSSPSQTNLQSLLVVPGDFSASRAVPHGAMASVRYTASALGGIEREMFVYTPPGYGVSSQRYPVLYLLHGGGDTAGSWPTVGRAGDIMDNLIAEGRAKQMIVVMPSGWTPSGGQVMTSDAAKDPFTAEMMKDIIPFIEKNYRVTATPKARALGGLSMGGIQTLNIGFSNMGAFRALIVMSSGWTTDEMKDAFYKNEADHISKANRDLDLFWWGWGETDIARPNAEKIIQKLKSEGVKMETLQTPGGHEWANWRRYLYETAPKLFR